MKSMFELRGGTYREENGYLLPNITVPEHDPRPIGRWGRLHESYLKKHDPFTYTSLLTNWKLDSYLININEQAVEMLDRLVTQMAKTAGITEELKAVDQMEWVRRMNSIRSRAEEIVKTDLIYV